MWKKIAYLSLPFSCDEAFPLCIEDKSNLFRQKAKIEGTLPTFQLIEEHDLSCLMVWVGFVGVLWGFCGLVWFGGEYLTRV